MEDAEFEVLVELCGEYLYAPVFLFYAYAAFVAREGAVVIVIRSLGCGEVGVVFYVFHAESEFCPRAFDGEDAFDARAEFLVQVIIPPGVL